MDKKKNILLVYDVKGWGAHVRAKYIQKYLSDEFNFLLLDSNGFKKFESSTNRGSFGLKDLNDFRVVSEDKEIFDIEEFKDFYQKRKSNPNIDLIYFMFHTMLTKKSARRILKTRDQKIITIVTGFPTLKSCFLGDGRNIFDEVSHKCDAIGANNNISLNDLKKVYNGKTFYACRGVDPNIFKPLSKTYRKKEEKFVVVYVGKPVPEKGLNIIREVCNRVGVKLIENTRNFTNALSPEKMNEFYNRADAYIIASTIDGSPNPLFEAAACGKPIIANHIGNTPEFIKNNYNGFLLKKEQDRNINKYVYWLDHLNKNREKCFEMGMNARKTVLKDWTWEKVLNKNERIVFRNILKEKE